jgi:EF-hand domain pair
MTPLQQREPREVLQQDRGDSPRESSWLRSCSRLPDSFVIDTSKFWKPNRSRQTMDISGIVSSSALHAVSGASTGAPPQQKMSSLFDSIDTSGSGSITQSQFEQAFQTKNPPAVFQKQGADAIFALLDPTGSGSVSKQDFVSTMSKLMASLRSGGSAPSGPQAADSLTTSLQALNQINPASVPPTAPPGTLINQSA